MGPEARLGLGLMCGAGFGAMQGLWVSVGGWLWGLCVGLRSMAHCGWLWLRARCGDSLGSQRCRQPQQPQLGSPRVSWGSCRAQLQPG